MNGRSAAAGRVVGGTFHSIAHRTLRAHAASLGLPEGFSVLDSSDAADVDRPRPRGARRRPRTGRRFPRKATLLDLYSRSVNTAAAAVGGDRRTSRRGAPTSSNRSPRSAAATSHRKRALGLLDFDDLLLYWRAAARRRAPRAAPRRPSIDHVCVDEYQDVNALQVDVLRRLRTSDPRLTVVGDDSQAVYGFRGASPRHLLDIGETFPGIATILLEHNYRSSQPILDVANAVGAEAPEGFSARLRSRVTTGPVPRLVRCADEDAQVEAVCEQILAHREEGIALREQAVLVRAAHHSDLLELELSRRRIPYVKYGGLRFLEAAHVKDLICLFRLADNPRDELAWFRLLQLVEGVGPTRARRAIEALGLAETGTDGEVLLRWPLALEELPVASRQRCRPPGRGVGRARGASRSGARRTAASRARAAGRAPYDNGEARLADLDALVAAAGDVARLSDVAADLTLEPPNSTGDLAGPPLIDEDWLVISTVHSAKGLEWDVVHLLNAADGNFPSDMALTTREGLEEERRLFYVAVTRPRRRCTSTCRCASTTGPVGATTTTPTGRSPGSCRARCVPASTRSNGTTTAWRCPRSTPRSASSSSSTPCGAERVVWRG